MECTSKPGCDSSSSRSVCAGRRGGPWAGPLWGCDSCLVRYFATWSAHATERPGPAVPHPAAVPPHHMEPGTSHGNGEGQRRRRWTVFLSAIWPPPPSGTASAAPDKHKRWGWREVLLLVAVCVKPPQEDNAQPERTFLCLCLAGAVRCCQCDKHPAETMMVTSSPATLRICIVRRNSSWGTGDCEGICRDKKKKENVLIVVLCTRRSRYYFPAWTRCFSPTLWPVRAATSPPGRVRRPAPCEMTWAPTSMCWKRSTCVSAAFWPKFTSWRGGISCWRRSSSRLCRDRSTATSTPARSRCRRTAPSRGCRALSGVSPTSGGKGSASRPCRGPAWRGRTRTASASR